MSVKYNLDTIYAHAINGEIYGVSKTRSEAERLALWLEPYEVSQGEWEEGYVIEIPPGKISDDFFTPEEGLKKYDFVVYKGDESHYVFPCPKWMRMGKLEIAA